MPLYAAPDIRQQTLAEAQAHLEGVRTRRMILLFSYQDKRAALLGNAHNKDEEKFTKQVAKLDAAFAKVNEALDKFENAIKSASATHNSLQNIENEVAQL